MNTESTISRPGVPAATSCVTMNCADPAKMTKETAIASKGGMPAFTASTP